MERITLYGVGTVWQYSDPEVTKEKEAEKGNHLYLSSRPVLIIGSTPQEGNRVRPESDYDVVVVPITTSPNRMGINIIVGREPAYKTQKGIYSKILPDRFFTVPVTKLTEFLGCVTPGIVERVRQYFDYISGKTTVKPELDKSYTVAPFHFGTSTYKKKCLANENNKPATQTLSSACASTLKQEETVQALQNALPSLSNKYTSIVNAIPFAMKCDIVASKDGVTKLQTHAKCARPTARKLYLHIEHEVNLRKKGFLDKIFARKAVLTDLHEQDDIVLTASILKFEDIHRILPHLTEDSFDNNKARYISKIASGSI